MMKRESDQEGQLFYLALHSSNTTCAFSNFAKLCFSYVDNKIGLF